MRLPLLFFLFICFAGSGQQPKPKIEDLNTGEAVENFIHSFDSSTFFKLKKINQTEGFFTDKTFCKRVADSLGLDKSFYKADLDDNGFLDLLVFGDYYGFAVFTILNFGNDTMRMSRLTRRSFQDCVFPKIITGNNGTKIDYYYQPDHYGYRGHAEKKPAYLAKKTLVYRFGDFVEYNEKLKNYNIERIEYKTTPCYGVCPIFDLRIENNRRAEFTAGSYNTKGSYWGKKRPPEMKGKFTAEIDSIAYAQLTGLLNYLDFPNLDNEYAVSWTDSQSCTLKITYDNGKTKEINDYGLLGTYGLDRLYEMLFELRFNQNWKQIEKDSKRK